MRNLIRIAGVAAALALVSSANAGVNLAANGQFSTTPALGPNQWLPGFGGEGNGVSGFYGWYNDNSSDWVEIGNSSTYGLPAAPGNAEGQNLEVNGNASPGTVYQDITLTGGVTYNVNWLYGGRQGDTQPGFAEGDTYTVVSLGGVNLAQDTGSEGVWTANWAEFTAPTTGSYELAFTGYTSYCGGTCGNEITNVSVSAVPELSTWAMMFAGFGALGFAGYRRKTAFAA